MSKRQKKKSGKPPAVKKEKKTIEAPVAQTQHGASLPDSIYQGQWSFMREEHYQGFMPHPNILRGFQGIYPDAPKIYFELLESETEHRRKRENRSDCRQFILQVLIILVFGGGIALSVMFQNLWTTIVSGLGLISAIIVTLVRICSDSGFRKMVFQAQRDDAKGQTKTP